MSDIPYPHIQYVAGVEAVAAASSDPENTLQVALTEQDLALVSFGIVLVLRLFPEIGWAVQDLNRRLMELAKFQNFLDWSEQEFSGSGD